MALKRKTWTEWQRTSVDATRIERMSTIHLTSGDAFYLRLLLKNSSGALSFNDLKTVDRIVDEDFQSACAFLNLCENDNQWIDCLQESVAIA